MVNNNNKLGTWFKTVTSTITNKRPTLTTAFKSAKHKRQTHSVTQKNKVKSRTKSNHNCKQQPHSRLIRNQKRLESVSRFGSLCNCLVHRLLNIRIQHSELMCIALSSSQFHHSHILLFISIHLNIHDHIPTHR